MCATYLVSGSTWLLAVIAYGFIARVLTGPTLSPLGRLVTHVITPRLPVEHRFVAGPPKRFAQGIGATLSTAALIAALLGAGTVATVLIAGIVVAAGLEAVVGYCLGCTIFGYLSSAGIIPEAACPDCADISRRLPELA